MQLNGGANSASLGGHGTFVRPRGAPPSMKNRSALRRIWRGELCEKSKETKRRVGETANRGIGKIRFNASTWQSYSCPFVV